MHLEDGVLELSEDRFLSHLTNEENHGASKGHQFCSLVMDLVLVVVQFTKSCLTLCDSVNCSMPGFLVFHYLLEFTKIHVNELVMLSNHLFFCLQSFPASGSFPVSWLFISGGQSIGASASASVLPINIQG